jgi:hypothetical protein
MSVLADLQSDKNERCQHGTSADDLGQTRQLLDCHRRDNSRAPHTLYSRNSRAYASLSEGLTKRGSKALIRVRCSRDLTKPLQRTAIRLDSMTYVFAEFLGRAISLNGKAPDLSFQLNVAELLSLDVWCCRSIYPVALNTRVEAH